jgi:DNA-directed RNA polymerase II subunit RPB2
MASPGQKDDRFMNNSDFEGGAAARRTKKPAQPLAQQAQKLTSTDKTDSEPPQKKINGEEKNVPIFNGTGKSRLQVSDVNAVINTVQGKQQELLTRPHPERYISTATRAVLDKYYEHNANFVTNHHLHSYNEFIKNGIRSIIRSMNDDFKMIKKDRVLIDGEERDIIRTVQVYVGGDEEANGVYVDRPTITDMSSGSDGASVEGVETTTGTVRETRLMFPNEARLRGLTYACNVYCDILLEYETDGIPIGKKLLEKYRIGLVPLMLHSDMCPLHDQPPALVKEMGECVYDQGGYFIVGGKEKVVVARESLVYNRLFVSESNDETKPPYIAFNAWVRAIDPDGDDLFPKTVRFAVYANDYTQRRNAIDVQVPSVKGNVPLFVLFRALGLESDRRIFTLILGENFDATSEMASIMRSCALAAGKVGVFDQLAAAHFMVERTNYKTIERMKQILVEELFPNAGKSFEHKTVYLAYLIGKLLRACTGVDPITNRDTYEHKRVHVSGNKLSDLFRDIYARFRKVAKNRLDFEYFSGPWRKRATATFATAATEGKVEKGNNQGVLEATSDIVGLVNASNERSIFDASIVDTGIIDSFKGAWNKDKTANRGKETEFMEEGVVQELNRISYLSYLSHVRRVVWAGNIAKMKEPHLLYGTQWGAICPVESPDGPNIGITKHLSTHCHVTAFSSPTPLIDHLIALELVQYATLSDLKSVDKTDYSVRVIVNDILVGSTSPKKAVQMDRYLLALRRNGLINPMTSFKYEVFRGEFNVFTDEGRCARPLFIADSDAPPEVPGHTDNPARLRAANLVDLEGDEWRDMLLGGALDDAEKDAVLPRSTGVTMNVLHPDQDVFAKYAAKTSDDVEERTKSLTDTAGIIEFVDVEESNARLIAIAPIDFDKRPCQKYTHCEIHPSTALSVPAACIPFMDRNNGPRNVFSMAQSKQSVGMPFTNFANRMDTMSAVLFYPQRPIVTTTFADRLCNGNLSYGENLIVAIACFSGYNQEDAVMIHRGAIQRGAFNSTHYHTVSFEEDSSAKERIEIGNPMLDPAVDFGDERAVKGIADAQEREKILRERVEERQKRFANIDEAGLPIQGSFVREGDVLVGRIHILTEVVNSTDSIGFSRSEQREVRSDASEMVDRSTMGHVDRVFRSGGKGKVRISQVRLPEFGDKCASRHGQKGVVGMVVPTSDMPYSALSGIVPDMIINPHAIPSRMTVGHLLECALAKTCAFSGRRVACDNFEKNDVLEELLRNDFGFDHFGDEVMYNSRTGEQLPVKVFIGPTYYMRLKHMVADKINHRATGPMTAITRQPNKGRGKHGGLRVGEMEQQALQSHGAASFLKESFMERSDKHWLDVDADTGLPVKISNEKTGYKVAFDEDNVDIRRLQVPYSFKVMQQELQALGVDMRLLLDEAVDEEDEARKQMPDARTRIHDLVREVLQSHEQHQTYQGCPVPVVTSSSSNRRNKTSTNDDLSSVIVVEEEDVQDEAKDEHLKGDVIASSAQIKKKRNNKEDEEAPDLHPEINGVD